MTRRTADSNPHLAWPDLPASELARLYDNNADLRNCGDLQRLRDRAAQLQRDLAPIHYRYGDADWATFDLYRPANASPASPVPLLVFVHGGRWRLNTSRETGFWAAAALAEGWALAVLNFPRLQPPQTRLPALVTAVGIGLQAVCTLAPSLGADARRLLVAGHSSGAHLALAVAQDGVARGAPWAAGLRRLLLLGGLYDLRPVLAAQGAEEAGFDATEAETMSPVLHVPARPLPMPVLVAVGAEETPEFVRQGRAMHWALSRSACDARWFAVPDAAHFDAALEMDRADSALRAFLRDGLSPRPA